MKKTNVPAAQKEHIASLFLQNGKIRVKGFKKGCKSLGHSGKECRKFYLAATGGKKNPAVTTKQIMEQAQAMNLT